RHLEGRSSRPARRGTHGHPIENAGASRAVNHRHAVLHTWLAVMKHALLLAEIPFFVTLARIVVLSVLIIVPIVLGAVLIQETQVGVVVKRFGGTSLQPGRLIALNGEA